MTQALLPEVLAKLVTRVPPGRPSEPSDVAQAVAFLGFAKASYIT